MLHQSKEKPVTKTAPKSQDIYQHVTNHIIRAIEAGSGTYQMPWHTDDAATCMRPTNAASGKPYRGVNVLALWATAREQGFSSNQWATYNQWKELGAQVRKGEKSTLAVFWKISAFEEQAPETSDETSTINEIAQNNETAPNHRSRGVVLTRGYPMFNAAQVDGYEPKPITTTPHDAEPESERVRCAEQFFANLDADIRHDGDQAFYRSSTDSIQMPPFELFHDAVSYYATLGHEATHWTAAKHRLDRNLSGRFGSQAYAAEELVAELGAAFLCAELSLSNQPRPDHAAYMSSWLQVLRSDPRAIFTAAGKAQQAIDYMQGFQITTSSRLTNMSVSPFGHVPLPSRSREALL